MTGFWSVVSKRPKVQGSEKWGMMCNKVKRSKVKWIDYLRWNVLSFIYIYVAVCIFCAVRCVIIICFSLLFSNYSTYLLIFVLHFFVLFVCFLFCVLFCVFVLLLHICLFPIFVQVYRPLSPAGNPTAVNKYRHHHYHVCSLKFNGLAPAVFVRQLLQQKYDAFSLQPGALKVDQC